jgi:hypothetical protein
MPEGGELRTPMPEGGELRTPMPEGGELEHDFIYLVVGASTLSWFIR